MRELIYYVAVSLDGFIAGPDGEFDAFLVEGDHMSAITGRYAAAIPTHIAEALDVPQDRSVFDTVVMGWNTYAVGLPHGITSPYRHLRQLVFSSHHSAEGENLEVSAEDPVAAVRRLKAEEGSGIWLCGGGALAATLAEEIDRLVLKRQPLVFGSGIALFGSRPFAPIRFTEVATTTFDSGVALCEYERTRS